jgi:hypothetical protein
VEHVHSRESDASGEAARRHSSAIGLWQGTYPLWTRQQRTPQRHPARAQAGRWASWRAVLAVVAEQEREKERDEGRGARGEGRRTAGDRLARSSTGGLDQRAEQNRSPKESDQFQQVSFPSDAM